MTQTKSNDDRTDHEQRKQIYERVLSCVDAQTSSQQPPGCTPEQVRLHLVEHGNCDEEPIRRAIQAVRENGDLVAWRGPDGDRRLTRATPARLRRATRWLGARTDDATPAVTRGMGRLNRALQECDRE